MTIVPENAISRPLNKKHLWLHKGVNIGSDNYLRCPHCNNVLAKGSYPDRPLEFMCRKCKGVSTFQRLK